MRPLVRSPTCVRPIVAIADADPPSDPKPPFCVAWPLRATKLRRSLREVVAESDRAAPRATPVLRPLAFKTVDHV